MRKVQIETKSKISFENIEGYYVKTVTKYGTGAKIDCLKEHLGKIVYVIVPKMKK
jgi:putative transposon-encoded protein